MRSMRLSPSFFLAGSSLRVLASTNGTSANGTSASGVSVNDMKTSGKEKMAFVKADGLF